MGRRRIWSDDKLTHKAVRCWGAIKTRCYNANNPGFKNYGGRGIQVCDRWLTSASAFIEDMGLPPSLKHSIDRINNDGNYEPGNCRWATSRQQASNRRDTVKVWSGSRWIYLRDWAAKVGIDFEFAYLCVHYWGYGAKKTIAAHAARLAKRSPAVIAYLARPRAPRGVVQRSNETARKRGRPRLDSLEGEGTCA